MLDLDNPANAEYQSWLDGADFRLPISENINCARGSETSSFAWTSVLWFPRVLGKIAFSQRSLQKDVWRN
jgi:hypothetical protein